MIYNCKPGPTEQSPSPAIGFPIKIRTPKQHTILQMKIKPANIENK